MEVSSSAFDIFAEPAVDSSIVSVNGVGYIPISAIINDSTLDFHVPAQLNNYINLSKTYLILRIKVSQIEVDTAKGIPEKTVYLAPLTPSCLFRQVDLYLNTTLVSTSSNNYPYRAYFETLLSFPSTVKKDMLTALEHIDGVQLAESKRGSVSLECLTRIYLDMFSQSKMLIPGVSLHLRLCRNSDDFIFHIPTTGSSNYQIELEEACLYIEHVTPNPSIALEHERRLARETCVYPISRSVVRAYHIPSGLQ